MRVCARVGLLVVAAAMWLLPASAARADPVCVGATAATSTIAADFNDKPIAAGTTIWFNGVVHPAGIPANQITTLHITGQTIKLDSQPAISVPDSVITFSPAVTIATTAFDAGSNTWRTTVPTKDVGNIFAAGVAFPVTVPGGLPAKLKAVSWTATFVSTTPNVKPHWQWAAAVYTQFGDLGSLGVKPVDKDNFSIYHNSDHAGTPENYKAYVTKGARGDGGTNYTGGLAGGTDITACQPQRVIVDTDLFSSADDAGALATAFDLQLRAEATVLAIGINTRTDRPAVVPDSWKCAAAIERFYGSAAPIGAHMPDDGTDVNSPDFIGPCAALGPASPPAPQTAVSVYRRALANAPDGSVVFACTGYLVNLADLLKSPPDGISPLSGRDLVARKVSMLVSMAGGYPSRTRENNLAGDAASAQYVAANWPTELVWAGYEVGDAVHTGDTLWASHPASSPLRAAYLAFVGPGNWYYSYDLVAAYHALRPSDPLLSEVGPGTNAIDAGGGNVFTAGPGNQYYLMFPDQTGINSGGTAESATDAPELSATLEGLLDTLPPGVSPGT